MLDNTTIADMHTHSKASHDSVCSIEEMCIAQMKKGTNIFAVTDHCDVYAYKDYDIYTPISKAYEQVNILNAKYDKKCLILSGIELSEAFWFPDEYKKIHNLVPYDVIIGSVHCVKYKELRIPYSKIDFMNLGKEKTYEYLCCYFDDIEKMIEIVDFDILAHLTCPLRYITGKYGINIDLHYFNNQIESILKKIIKRNIALEVNTSEFKILGDTMPSMSMLRKYYHMGGDLITLGSDAHVSQNASTDFNKVINQLREIGFDSIYYFRNRKIHKIKI